LALRKENEFHRRVLENLKRDFDGYILFTDTKGLYYHPSMEGTSGMNSTTYVHQNKNYIYLDS
jgi:hypothetical protein